tara:strand:+ start:409 stop:849 length:441 start_codon:yes stop_codon:yes gene_type:complete
MKQVKCCTVKTNGKVSRIMVPEGDLRPLIKSVGGDLEAIGKIGYDFGYGIALGNENAKKQELPINMPVTIWLNCNGVRGIFHGDVVIVGLVPKEENFSDCPIDVWEEMPQLLHAPKFRHINISLDSPESIKDALAELLGEIEKDIE